MRIWAGGLLALTLAGCQIAGLGGGRGGAETPPPNPITGAAVEVTVLDAPASADPPAGAAPADVAAAPRAAAAAEITPTEEAAAPAAEEVARVLSPAALACERRGGVWSTAVGGMASFCQTPLRDAGKACTQAGDCEGQCLARSRSCAPVAPLFGCHEILNDFGQVLTECIN